VRPRSNFPARALAAACVVAAGIRLLARRERRAGGGEPAAGGTNSTLVSIVAHEIRAPLAAIRGAVALLDEHDATLEPARRAELLRVAQDATKQLGYLVDDLLLISRIAGGRLTIEGGLLDIVSVVHDAANAELAHAVAVVEQDGIPLVSGDAQRVRQVVTNLLSNAVANAAEASIVLASITRHDDDVRVTIYNEGRGIPPEEQSRLFLPFAALTERRVDSTGLGLYIAKELVEAMGGRIGFDTQPGRNAAFWFTLKAATRSGPLAHRGPR
jgi:signal transduction histidine kinase